VIDRDRKFCNPRVNSVATPQQMSEIDDIFSFKGKAPAIQPIATASSLPAKKKKAKDKKRKRDAELADHPSVQPSRPAPETVFDPSTLVSSVKRPKIEKRVKVPMTLAKEADLESTFTDSRGSRPRKKTEEGWAIYKEEELGIREEGGGKHFICCSFSLLMSAWTQTRHYAHLTVNAVSKTPVVASNNCVTCFPCNLLSKRLSGKALAIVSPSISRL